MENKRIRQAVDARLAQLNVSGDMERSILSKTRGTEGKRMGMG